MLNHPNGQACGSCACQGARGPSEGRRPEEAARAPSLVHPFCAVHQGTPGAGEGRRIDVEDVGHDGTQSEHEEAVVGAAAHAARDGTAQSATAATI